MEKQPNEALTSKPMLTAVFCVGDAVISDSPYHGYAKTKVARTTSTQAILENGVKLKIDRNGSTAIGSTGYGATHYYKSTPELEETYKTWATINGIKNRFPKLPLKELSKEDLAQLCELVKSLHTKYCS